MASKNYLGGDAMSLILMLIIYFSLSLSPLPLLSFYFYTHKKKENGDDDGDNHSEFLSYNIIHNTCMYTTSCILTKHCSGRSCQRKKRSW